MARPPSLLTVEEAAQLLRIGRTKAYAMARQWRESGGQRGLPVLDLGDVLRVPLAQLEKFTGAEFSELSDASVSTTVGPSAPPPVTPTAPPDEAPRSAGSPPDRPAKPLRRRRQETSAQLGMFATHEPSG